MDPAAIIALITKGLTIAQALIDAGESAAPAIEALLKGFGGKTAVTQADLDKTEAALDKLLDEFEIELPPA